MISKNLQKLIRSLEQKKYRSREQLFIAEGPKVVGDLLATFHPRYIFATQQWLNEYSQPLHTEIFEVADNELSRLSFLQHPQQVIALFHIPPADTIPCPTSADNQLLLALDNIQDPGNMGTIIRIADWFGIRHIVCQAGSADAYNPKVVQATMGSLARVNIHYTSLPQWLDHLPPGTPIYGTSLDGDNIYSQPLSPNGVIIMGNEGNGISNTVRQRITRRLFIPSYPAGLPTAESLNVAIATALTCAEFRRRCL